MQHMGVDGWDHWPPFFGAMTQSTGELHDMHYPISNPEREFITDSGGAGNGGEDWEPI